MADATGSTLQDLAAFLQRLEKARIHYTLTSVREGVVMVQLAVPGERWEIEFFPDLPPDIEVFRSTSVSDRDSAELFEQLFREHGV